MSRPTVAPSWATSTNFAAGIAVGTPTKVAPGGGNVAEGFDPGTKPPAQWFNYMLGNHGDWLTWLDNGFVSTPGALAALTGIPDNARIFVRSVGFSYPRVAAGTGQTADGYWIVTSADGGQFVHPSWNDAVVKKLAPIGPVPGDSYTAATNAGRINRDLVPFGVFDLVPIPAGQFTTTDATNVDATNGHVFDTITVGTLAIGDYVFAHLSATGFNLVGNFQVGVYISYDNGATYAIVSPDSGAGSAFSYAQTAAGVAVTVAVSFVDTVLANGICKIQFKGSAPGGGTTFFTRGRGFAEVKRF